MVTVPRLLLQSCVLCRTAGELSSNYWTLQALACDVLPPTIVVIDHVIGLEKLNCHSVSQRTVFLWSADGSKFATDKSDYIRRFFYNRPRCLRQHKYNQNRLNRDGTK